MNALSIRQPYAEEILRGIKKIEYRNRPTKVIGVTFYIYAAMKVPTHAGIPERFRKLGSAVGGLPTGLLVGTAKISKCTPWVSGGDGSPGDWEWHLTDVKRLKTPLKHKRHPMPSWFRPF